MFFLEPNDFRTMQAKLKMVDKR